LVGKSWRGIDNFSAPKRGKINFCTPNSRCWASEADPKHLRFQAEPGNEYKQPRTRPVPARMDNLGTLIQKRNWIDTRTYIHGPLGDLRGTMKSVSASLLPKDREKAVDLTKSLFADLVNLDIAAKDLNYAKVSSSYQKAVNDFDAFLQLIPKA
jgi:photosystem II protein PsbQ